MPRVLEKVERRLGEKLFLKGERCLGPKCAYVRRSQPPGMHGKSRRRRRDSSEYGSLLKEKMKMRYYYGLDDGAVKRYVGKAVSKRGIFHTTMFQLLERRLDSAVFRIGFTASRAQARQAISHGHININNRRVRIPSYELKVGDTISIRSSSAGSALFGELHNRLRSWEPPRWLTLNKETPSATVVGLPELEQTVLTLDATKVKEFYSR